MKRHLSNVLGAALLLAAGAASTLAQTPVDNGWTYQGRLTVGGGPATGNYDLRFTLYSNSAGTAQVGSPQPIPNVAVSAGLFTVHLDFGAQFTGSKRWLKIEVSPAGAGTYTALPLQEVTSAPQSLFAERPWATDASGNISFTGGKVGIGRTPTYGFDVNVAAGQSMRLGLDGNGGGQLILANNNGDNNIYLEGWSTNGASSANGMFFAGFQGGPIPNLSLNASNVTMPAPASKLTIGDQTGIDCRLSVAGSSSFPVYSECFSPQPGCNAVRAIIDAGASNNYSCGVAGINLSTPTTNPTFGVYGSAAGLGWGVFGESASYIGVAGSSHAAGGYGGYFTNSANGIALWADGLAQVKTLRILGGSDLAEPFDVSAVPGQETIEPGMVVVIDESRPGELRLADQPYDGKVAGVISGANGLAPGMVMKAEGQEHADGQHPVAMTGRVWVWVDASFGAVRPGDLLTTSATAGHAMRASDQSRSFGAVVGKAMTGLPSGKGLVMVLVNLQ